MSDVTGPTKTALSDQVEALFVRLLAEQVRHKDKD
jgi:hypothetical protein